ncbi:MAG: S9 family peptidase, partial [Gammaproteobacteria bacterium]
MRLPEPTFWITLACLALTGCAEQPDSGSAPGIDTMKNNAPPIAATRPRKIATPHGDRIDDYYWLRDDAREDPEVLAYLAAENNYTAAQLAHVGDLQDRLFAELVGRMKKDDSTVPARHRGYFYYERYAGEAEYPIHARRKGSLEAPEEIMLDVNVLAAGHDYYHVGNYDVSPDNRLLAYAEDTSGRRIYTIRFKDLTTGETLPDALPGNGSSLAWAGDNRTLFYIEKDPTTLLGVRVRRHRLGDDPGDDPLVYEEPDHSFYMDLGHTGDDRYIALELSSTVSDELRYLPVDQPDGRFEILLPRRRDHEYEADHVGDRWIIRTNWQAENFRIMTASDADAHDRSKWVEFVPHDENVYIGEFAAFRDFIAIAERRDALRRLRV